MKKNRKLHLDRETLRPLGKGELEAVAGGTIRTVPCGSYGTVCPKVCHTAAC